MATRQCAVSGQFFSVSAEEIRLREKFGFSNLPAILPRLRLRELGAFWPHWNLHPRKCDQTGKNLISIFRPDCDFPVWDREEWVRAANPPSRDFDFSQPFFEQAWEVFRRSPIPHVFQSHNENCEYTDDFYYGKNCYLCHSCNELEDSRYCYLASKCKDVQNTIYAGSCELGSDIVNSLNCFDAVQIAFCRQISNCAFLYDCRNCSDCMFCCNLRNKQYCFDNRQLTKSEYLARKTEWNLSSRSVFDRAKERFRGMLRETAWHRALQIDHCENSSGNYLTNCKNCENCCMSPDHEDCVHDFVSGPNARMTLDCMGTIGSELAYYSVMVVYCYQTRFCFELNACRFCDYSAYCFNCKECFGCCGLFGRTHCIFNKQYSPTEYQALKTRIIEHMQSTDEWGRFFPGKFAPNPYAESCSDYYFPLAREEQARLGFRTADPLHRKTGELLPASKVPATIQALIDRSSGELDPSAVQELTAQTFWDEEYSRPFRITKGDIVASFRLGIPLPNCYYVARMKENLSKMPGGCDLRAAICAKSGTPILTGWPEEYDGRILSEAAYLETVV